MYVFKKSKMVTLDVFNISKISNMYILNIFLKRYCAVWAIKLWSKKRAMRYKYCINVHLM